jgi:type IV pilus assembly protein PilF
MTDAMRGRARACFLTVWLVGAVVAVLSGCSSTGSAAYDSGRTDLVTDSDEPEARKRARIRVELAVGYFQHGQTKVALDEIKQALVIDPSFPVAYNLRGVIYMRLNDPQLAEDSFKRALQLSPNNGDVLHNYGWLLCQQSRYPESFKLFRQAVAVPTYGDRAKTWLTLGLCELKAGQRSEAEKSLVRSYELDAGNPVTGYNLSLLLYQRGELVRSQFYIRRLNSSDLANAESLWLGIKIERTLGNREVVEQLSTQLRKRFPQSRELDAYERRSFNE